MDIFPSLLGTSACICDKSLAHLSVGTSYFSFFNNLTSRLAIIFVVRVPSSLLATSVCLCEKSLASLIGHTSDIISVNNAPSQSRIPPLFKQLCPPTLALASVINHLHLSA